MCAALPCCLLCGFDQKHFTILHLLSAASSSSSDVPSGLNASENNAASADTGPPPRFVIGVALTFGFTLMFVVDQIGSYCSTRGKLAELSCWLHFAECHLYTYTFCFINTCAMSHFRPNEQCRHYSHCGAGYSCCRY